MLRIVLDTNCLFVSLSSKSRYRKILDSLINNNYELIVTNEILLEYLEIVTKYGGVDAEIELEEIIYSSDNIEFIDIFYKWNMISADVEDNKFVDCAIAGNADYIVTDDKHFEELKKIEFPKVTTITTEEFLKIISEN